MQNLSLNFVDKQADGINEIRSNIARFNQKANVTSNEYRARDLLRRTRYWVYDEATDIFGPSKFVGFKLMTFECYDASVATKDTGKFNGTRTRKAIESTLRSRFVQVPGLYEKLTIWAENLLGEGVFDGVCASKWRFIQIP
jgi:hypothetical protein